MVIISTIFLYTREQSTYKDGTYYNQAYGYHSEVKVEVVVKEGKIDQINIIGHEEPKILADIVFEELPQRMIKKNSAQVDAISGATYTSKSLIQAVEKALNEAKLEDE